MDDLDETAFILYERRLLALADKAIKQAILARDVAMACKYELKKVAIESADRATQFEALRRAQNIWFQRGRDMGLIFDMEVSIALSGQCLKWAIYEHQRSTVVDDINNALHALAEILGTGVEDAKQ